jgi:tRNA dimethylallyltransferase
VDKLLIIIAGPTASGKTALSIAIAERLKTIIVSADSRQVFRELSIGTAKPSQQELKKIHHYFINSHSITEEFNAGIYAIQATELLKKLFLQYDVILMCGGSGLYIDAVINGIDDLPLADKITREELLADYKLNGLQSLQEKLLLADPDAFSTTDIKNPQRVMRALEIIRMSGTTYSSLIKKQKAKLPFRHLMFGIELPRELLYERINVRTKEMFNSGLIEEVKSVISHRNSNALKTVGYKEVLEYLDGKISVEEAESMVAKNTRNYAKRQLTWFRRYPEMIWLREENASEEIINYINTAGNT